MLRPILIYFNKLIINAKKIIQYLHHHLTDAIIKRLEKEFLPNSHNINISLRYE